VSLPGGVSRVRIDLQRPHVTSHAAGMGAGGSGRDYLSCTVVDVATHAHGVVALSPRASCAAVRGSCLSLLAELERAGTGAPESGASTSSATYALGLEAILGACGGRAAAVADTPRVAEALPSLDALLTVANPSRDAVLKELCTSLAKSVDRGGGR
jgi:hypothetical protein